jgi:YVTN family beta-propeller protein
MKAQLRAACPLTHSTRAHARTLSVLFLIAGLITTTGVASGQVSPSAFVNFEGAQTNPIRLSGDGTRLYAVNTPDARVSVFDTSNGSAPLLIGEIAVGIEPVSVNPRTNDEVWVVNQVSDSVSVVSVSKGIVIDTIYVKDEPSDVVFAGQNLAFVSVSRSNKVCVYDALTRQLLATIPLQGGNPRALAVSPNGQTVYALFAISGNRTTLIPSALAPAPPPPTNPALPPAPQVGLIIDALDPRFSAVINFTLPDNDVAVIDTATLTVSGYYPRAGTINLGIAVRPTTGDLYVSNTDARNRVRFEPNVRGHWVDNRITRITPSGQVSAFDLNPGVDYGTLPNPAALSTALAQPAGLVFDPNGQVLYVAAFGTDRVAKVGADGRLLRFIDMGSAGPTADPRHKRGPRGLALNAAAQQLYVLNRISNTISVIDTSTYTLAREFPTGSFDPTPQVIRDGRGFLYDAKLSGNGNGSCASCHIDADMDKLAWDLGDPGGDMTTVTAKDGTPFDLHPMKGPMTTQTLRGLADLSPYHWRGDRAEFSSFNPAFDSLMGGTPLTDVDMAAYTAFVNTIRFQPNPNQNLDRTLPTSLNGADATAGRALFLNLNVGLNTCNGCHTSDPGPGTSRNIVAAGEVATQPLKVPQLRNIYQKLDFAARIDGFGLTSDGAVPQLPLLFAKAFPFLADKPVVLADLSAFVASFDTGTAPAVGYTRTVTAANINDPAVQADWNLLEQQTAVGNIDLILKGTINKQVRGAIFRPGLNVYRCDKLGIQPLTRAALTTLISQGDTLTLMGVPFGSGLRMGVDRNLDGILDGDQ